jgi:hypothetical protein
MPRLTIAAAALAALCLVLGGCSGSTPEERLMKISQMIQQNDSLGAMLEARTMIKKFPEHPRTVEAHYLLGRVYLMDRRPDEALAEYELVLGKVPQTNEFGRNALREYLNLLQGMKRIDDALAAVDKYQKQYADDAGTSLSLTVARATIMTADKRTTPAREILLSLRGSTTTSAEMALYRQLIAQTHMVDGNPTAALEMFLADFDTEKGATQKREIAQHVSALYMAGGDYAGTREWAAKTTELFDRALKDELDVNRRVETAFQLAGYYSAIGNLAGAAAILQRLHEMNLPPAIEQEVVRIYATTLLRQGKVDETVKLMREVASRFPESKLDLEAARLESMKAQGQMAGVPEMDTAPLTLRFSKDELLIPANLPSADSATTPTAAAPAAGSAPVAAFANADPPGLAAAATTETR